MKDSTPSTKDRILDHLATRQTDDEGWMPYELNSLYAALPDKAPGNIQGQLSELLRAGKLEGKKSGRNYTHLRLGRAHSLGEIKAYSGSQTERALHYLYGLADPKGNIPDEVADVRSMQLALGFRDYHDVNKALHNLNKLGILAFRQIKVGGSSVDHRMTNLRLRLERQQSWPLDLVKDDIEWPGKTEPDEVNEVVELGQEEMDTLVEISEPQKPAEPEEVVNADEMEPMEEVAIFDPDKYPEIAKAVRRYHSRKQALGLLRKSGDDEIADLLAEKHDDPVVAELARFLTTVGFYG
jgi:hypothetical protein